MDLEKLSEKKVPGMAKEKKKKALALRVLSPGRHLEED